MARKQKEEKREMFGKLDSHFGAPNGNDCMHMVLVLEGDITTEKCTDIICAIVEANLVEERPDVIDLMITSHGGDMDAAIALITVIRGSAIPVRTIAMGTCGSAALAILMAGHQRVACPFTSLLSHQFSTGVAGTYNDLKQAAVEFQSYYDKMVSIYELFTGLDRAKIESELLTHQDVFLTPDMAKHYGIVDVVSWLD